VENTNTGGEIRPHSEDHKINPIVKSRLSKLGWGDSTYQNYPSMYFTLNESVRLFIYLSNSLNDDVENEEFKRSSVLIENDAYGDNHFVESIYESENLDDIIEFTNTLIGLADANLDELIKKYNPNKTPSMVDKLDGVIRELESINSVGWMDKSISDLKEVKKHLTDK